ncbi:MAG: cystathionine beta-synthase [Winogradskyella sp.]|uniref:cystathionine beta-synthase n=1 Tax=Winogradskyella sp. TaxID=1883156 RepID=UPI0018426242|nr:cystathionine beta-synthase [Winogradskyella sp.]
MQDQNLYNYINILLKNVPSDWVNLTTHRLDIYNESLAKTQFLDQFETLYQNSNAKTSSLQVLPTAYDYIRLGHPLSCILEWAISKIYGQKPEHVISFSSQVMPILAVLRANLISGKKTQICYVGNLPDSFDAELIRRVYNYSFEIKKVEKQDDISTFNGSTIFISKQSEMGTITLNPLVDFYINLFPELGSVLIINGADKDDYVSNIQHVRRRETIAMTPSNSLIALKTLGDRSSYASANNSKNHDKKSVLKSIESITATSTKPIVGSSGLSIQYAIMMGLIDDAQGNYHGKAIKFIVPTNCYGGTNDQARRVAACSEHIDVLDLEVDGENNMVSSLETVLTKVAHEDAIPYIIAEIPTNPRVEVPDLEALKTALTKTRKTANGDTAIDPVFILDQTFCPNIKFLAEDEILSHVRSISYVSGSKFPSGGKCTAGYCVANQKGKALMAKIEQHLMLCDNEATIHQFQILAKQMPSMNDRIADAYTNTREFVSFIQEVLPKAKINFVSEELAARGFTPSVFSLDLPTKGNTAEEKEAYKRELNHKLINLMITEIPNESKYCVSYGQLNGCYWTIPATSTQGTTKEDDKDYIARVAVSPDLNLEKHKAVFLEFVENI